MEIDTPHKFRGNQMFSIRSKGIHWRRGDLRLNEMREKSNLIFVFISFVGDEHLCCVSWANENQLGNHKLLSRTFQRMRSHPKKNTNLCRWATLEHNFSHNNRLSGLVKEKTQNSKEALILISRMAKNPLDHFTKQCFKWSFNEITSFLSIKYFYFDEND